MTKNGASTPKGDGWTLRRGWVLAWLGLAGACASPATQFDTEARDRGLVTQRLVGNAFEHAVYLGNGIDSASDSSSGSRRLHVYLGGDGTPTIAGRPAVDPTPRNPLALRLLALDPGAAIYLGRPCYHGVGPPSACLPPLWTDGRYSEPVVASMATALRRFLLRHDFDSISWFGYSGGGTLAALLAPRFPESVAVVTIAANLDVGAWTRHHRHAAFAGSLDPALRSALPQDILQWHYVGAEDRVVPPAVQRSLKRRWQARWVEVPGFDHVCCWEEIWPEALSAVAEDLKPPPRNPGPAQNSTFRPKLAR